MSRTHSRHICNHFTYSRRAAVSAVRFVCFFPTDEHDDDIEGVLSGPEPPDVWRRRRQLRAG